MGQSWVAIGMTCVRVLRNDGELDPPWVQKSQRLCRALGCSSYDLTVSLGWRWRWIWAGYSNHSVGTEEPKTVLCAGLLFI